MTCKEKEKYDQGEMDEAEFKRHAANCSTCQEIFKLDEEVMSMAKSLRRRIEAPQLWNRIEESLATEMTGERRPAEGILIKKRRWKLLRLAPAMVALIVAVWLGIHIVLKSRTSSSGLLAYKALVRVEQKEQEYLKAIQDLEKQVIPKMDSLDLELVFLYRDRLETIDAQIKQCQEALATNPANAHIRRYLMMALHDKKETLAEVLDLKDEKLKSRRSL